VSLRELRGCLGILGDGDGDERIRKFVGVE
jgi:hypothetical protein